MTSSKFTEENDIDTLLTAARKITNTDPDKFQAKVEEFDNIQMEAQRLQEQERNTSLEIAKTKKRLEEIFAIRDTFDKYNSGLKTKIQRIGIVKWLLDNRADSAKCPLCGNLEHPSATAELDYVLIKVKELEEQLAASRKYPSAIGKEEGLLRKRLSSLYDEQRSLQECIDILVEKHHEAKEAFQGNKQRYQFIGQLKTTIRYVEGIYGDKGLQTRINELELERGQLKGIVDNKAVENVLNETIYSLNLRMQQMIKKMDVDDRYSVVTPKFLIKDLSIEVQSNDGSWHLIAEVGSASNWVSFHIALMCSFQELFIDMKSKLIPSFVIFDQPSQVYFPKLDIKYDDNGNPIYKDKDVIAVRKIFTTIRDSVVNKKGMWQAIILEHANKSVYNDIDGIHEVEEWREGFALVPHHWIE